MANITANLQVYGDAAINVWTAPLTASAPAAYPAVPGSSWSALGWLEPEAGITESISRTETEIYGLQGLALLLVVRSKEKRPVKFTALEENTVTAGLLNPFGSTTTSGGTAEQQTITITGVPTGGTFDVSLTGYGTAAANAYNVPAATLQAALIAAFGITGITVALASNVYTVTFPVSVGNVPQITTVNGLTGGTTPTAAVATTVPGVNPVNTTLVKPATGINRRQFAIDLVSGSGVYHRRWYQNAEAIQDGDLKLASGDSPIEYAFTLNPYMQTNGAFYTDVNNNPLLANGLFV